MIKKPKTKGNGSNKEYFPAVKAEQYKSELKKGDSEKKTPKKDIKRGKK